MIKELQISLSDLIMCLSGAMDLVSNEVVNHQKRVGYIALRIAAESGLPLEEQNRMMKESVLLVLQKMAKNHELDPAIVSLLERHYDDINYGRCEAQESSHREYSELFLPWQKRMITK